jgi:hypothetical protein
MSANPVKLPGEKPWPALHQMKAWTPDPNEYHDTGAGTLLPHSLSHAGPREDGGLSPAFSPTDKAVAFVDPENPYTGDGAAEIVDFAGRRRSIKEMTEKHEPASQAETQKAATPVSKSQPVPSRDAEFQRVINQDPADENLKEMMAEILMRLRHEEFDGPPKQAVQEVLQPQTPTLDLTTITAAIRAQLVAEAKRDAVAQEAKQTEKSPSTYEEIGMPWLGRYEPLPPKLQVIFHLPNGLFRTRYWAAGKRKKALWIAIDERFDGDLFMPSVSKDPVHIEIPELRVDTWVCNGDISFTPQVKNIGAGDVAEIVTYLVLVEKLPPVEAAENEDEA